MSLAQKIAASKRAARVEAEQEAAQEQFNNRYIARTILKAKENKTEAFPSFEIESLTEIAYKVVAKNFHRYPDLEGVTDKNIHREIVRLVDKRLPVTTVAKNIDFEFYWQEKCEMAG